MDAQISDTADLQALERRAAEHLRQNHPIDSASFIPTPVQRALAILSVAALLLGLTAWPAETAELMRTLGILAFLSLSLFRLLCSALARPLVPVDRPEFHAPRDWPVYSIIAPLYKEGPVAIDLIDRLKRIDYPHDKLDLLIMLEADDADTLDALHSTDLPAWARIVVLPAGKPKTKPKACTAALALARGQYITIYDAEDAPHPHQLKAAVLAFEAGDERLACLQAPLDIDNTGDGWLSCQFALEYGVQFRLIIPALSRLGLPIALGGTSNHFRTDVLRDLGGWDPYNLTEDADLGFRLAAHTYKVQALPYPTYEEAPRHLPVWVNQRSRWIKGFMQTWGVRMRSWHTLMTGAGLWGFLVLHLTIGASIVSAFVHGPLLLAVGLDVITGLQTGHWHLRPIDGLVLFAAYATWLLSAALASRQLGVKNLAFTALSTPFYWPLQTLAAIKAGYELVTKPFHWSKTPHGLAMTRSF